MKYPEMGRNRSQRLNIPQLLGGLNTATNPALIEDDELSAVCNLTFDHGALVTREAVRAALGKLWQKEGVRLHVNSILRQPTEINGVMSTVVVSSVIEMIDNAARPSATTVDVITLEGMRTQYAGLSTLIKPYAAIAPCSQKEHGASFLVYSDGEVYASNDDNSTLNKVSGSELYAPLVMINGRSVDIDEANESANLTANGVMYEGFNLLTGRYRAQFTPSVGADATSNPPAECYQLPTRINLAAGVSVAIKSIYGETTVAWSSGEGFKKFTLGGTTYGMRPYPSGCVTVVPPLPVTDAANTVTFTCNQEIQTKKMPSTLSMAAWFGGTQNDRGGTRLFLADAESAKLMWSDINDPFYFPENNYMYVGDTSQKITALAKQGDMLVIFKEREIYYTTYVQGEIDAEAVAEGTNVDVAAVQAYFPLTQLSPQIGCRCPQSIALCRDRLVWMDSDARVYTLVITGAYSERNVREIGQKVRPFILENTTEAQRKIASAIDHKGKYRLMIGSRMVEFDYNDSGFVNVSGYSSGERAARNIAWMAHEYSFGDNAVQTLVSDGADKAVIISTVSGSSTFARVLYAFDAEKKDDSYLMMAEDGAFQTIEPPITVSLTTKSYEFGDPVAYKRIDAFYPMMQVEDAKLYFIADGYTPPYGKWYQSADTFAHLVMPSIKRCRSFGLKIDATGKVCIKGMLMQYSMFGNVK